MKITIDFNKDEINTLQTMNDDKDYTEKLRAQAMLLVNQIIDNNTQGYIKKVTLEG